MRVLLVAVLLGTIAVFLWALRTDGTSVAEGAAAGILIEEGAPSEGDALSESAVVLDGPADVAVAEPLVAPSGDRVLAGGPAAEASAFFVRVLHELDDTPLAGARVRVHGVHATEPRRTDEAGLVRIDGVPLDGAAVFRVELEGFTPAAARCEGEPTSPELARTIRLRPTARLAVTFVDTTGRPVPRLVARVQLLEGGAWPDSVFEHPDVFPEVANVAWSAVAHADGVARFDELPAGAPLIVTPAEGDPREVQLVPGEANTLELLLDLATRITGVVRDEHGRPAAGARVVTTPRRGDWVPNGGPPGRAGALADEAGRYDLFRVEPGEYWLTHAYENSLSDGAPPPSFAIEPTAVDVTGEVGLIEVDLEAWSDTAISGVVLGAEELHVSIDVRAVDVPDSYLPVSAREGAFRTGALLPGRYLLRAGQYGEPVEAHTGDDGVVLRLRPRHWLRGRVQRAEAVVMKSIWVVRSEDDWERTWASLASVKRDGSFEIEVDEGAYTLLARYEDGDVALADVRVSAATDALELAPAPSGELVLRNDGPAAVHWTLAYTWVPVQEGELGPGASATVRAPACGLRLTWSASTDGADPLERALEVVAGSKQVVGLGESER